MEDGRRGLDRRLVVAVLRRPQLWVEGGRTLVRLASPGWWRRWPPVPAPNGEYLRFRTVTNRGGAGWGAPEPDELVAYLKWCRSMRRVLE